MPSGRRQNKVSIEGNRHSPIRSNNCSLVSVRSQTLFSKTECTKIVRELNREVSRYCAMVIWLGGSQDSECLRADLRECRHKAYNLAQQVQAYLMPHLKREPRFEDTCDFNGLWTLYVLCLDMLEVQIRRTIHLLRDFPFHNGSTVLINTGVLEPANCRTLKNIMLENLDVSLTDKKMLEHEEMKSLKREIYDLHDMIAEMHRVDIKPWTLEGHIVNTYQEQDQSIRSNSECSSSMVEVVSIDDASWHGRKRCICLISSVVVCVILFSAVLGVCIALFT